MLELGSTLEDETLTINFATFENPENFCRKHPVEKFGRKHPVEAHLNETTARLPLSDSRRKRVKFRHRGSS